MAITDFGPSTKLAEIQKPALKLSTVTGLVPPFPLWPQGLSPHSGLIVGIRHIFNWQRKILGLFRNIFACPPEKVEIVIDFNALRKASFLLKALHDLKRELFVFTSKRSQGLQGGYGCSLFEVSHLPYFVLNLIEDVFRRRHSLDGILLQQTILHALSQRDPIHRFFLIRHYWGK